MGYTSLNSSAGSWQRAQTMSGGLLNWALGEIEPVHSRFSALNSSATTRNDSTTHDSDGSRRSNGGRTTFALGRPDPASESPSISPYNSALMAAHNSTDLPGPDWDSDGSAAGGSDSGSDAPSNGSSSGGTGSGGSSLGAPSLFSSGASVPGGKPPAARRSLRQLTSDEAASIYLAQHGPKSLRAAARLAHEFNVTAKAIRDVWTRKTWVAETMHVWSMTASNDFVPPGVSSSGSAAAAMRVRRALCSADAP